MSESDIFDYCTDEEEDEETTVAQPPSSPPTVTAGYQLPFLSCLSEVAITHNDAMKLLNHFIQDLCDTTGLCRAFSFYLLCANQFNLTECRNALGALDSFLSKLKIKDKRKAEMFYHENEMVDSVFDAKDKAPVCALCDCDLEAGDHVVRISECSHVFHRDCLREVCVYNLRNNKEFVLCSKCPTDKCDELLSFTALVNIFSGDSKQQSSIENRAFALFTEYFPQIAVCPQVDPENKQVCNTIIYLPTALVAKEQATSALKQSSEISFNGCLTKNCCFAVRCPRCVERFYPDLSAKGALAPYHYISGLPTNDSYNCFHRMVHAYFCRNCNRLPHFPASCAQTEEFMRQLQTDGASLALITNKFTKCPKCNFFVEKSTGCNHMTCRCKHEFCYVCGGGWAEHSKSDYYGCNVGRKNKDGDKDTMTFLEAFRHFKEHIMSAELDLRLIGNIESNTSALMRAHHAIQMSGGSNGKALDTPDTTKALLGVIKNVLTVARLLIAFSTVKVFVEKIDEANMHSASPHHLFVLRKGMVLKETEKLSGLLKDIRSDSTVSYDKISATIAETRKWCHSLDAF